MAMTEQEKYLFDLNGYFIRPSILSADEVAAITDQLHRIRTAPESLPPEERGLPGGAASVLIDHPKVIDVMHEVIGPELRLEGPFAAWRERGQGGQVLHGGNGCRADPIYGYRVENGRIFAGQVRVVYELTEVTEDDGATGFLPGSHKSHFAGPPRDQVGEGWLAPFTRSYSCPAGSAVFFTEALAHGGRPWARDTPRVAVLHLYNHQLINSFHTVIPPEVLAGLSKERQAYFRLPWRLDSYGKPGVQNTTERFLLSDDEPLLNFEPLKDRVPGSVPG